MSIEAPPIVVFRKTLSARIETNSSSNGDGIQRCLQRSTTLVKEKRKGATGAYSEYIFDISYAVYTDHEAIRQAFPCSQGIMVDLASCVIMWSSAT